LDTATIISLVIAACALLFTAFGFRRTQNQDTSATAAERATMTANIQYIRQSIDEIKLDNRTIKTDLEELKIKVSFIDASAKSAHKRIDDLQKGQKG
jgi:type II secretory pathway pseudopilin PulG